MSELAISVNNIAKVFRIGIQDQASDSLGGVLLDMLRSPVRNYRKYRSLYNFSDIKVDGAPRPDVIWALRDVSFDIREGEVVGIIGRNGAGKSTLLKILTRITPPTRGVGTIRGRVSSLLEVGTGFHRELTGRENIYLNGTILGMKKREVDQRFDEIVAFSGVEKFLDTPVKRYSSGMAVRLAFAVAAHLEPEILIVDEVLAVGDTDFQKKCINKMKQVHQQGRTVLLVSHNMPAITTLCSRAILLKDGTVAADGQPHDVVAAYMNSGLGSTASKEWPDNAMAPGGRIARLRSVRVVGGNGRTLSTAAIKDEVGIEMRYTVTEPGPVMLPSCWLHNDEGVLVFVTLGHHELLQTSQRGDYVATAWIPGNLLTAGTFFVTATLNTRAPDTTQFNEEQVISFTVLDGMGSGTARGDWGHDMPGVVRPLLEWTVERAGAHTVKSLVERRKSL